jgi:hypothetical protein
VSGLQIRNLGKHWHNIELVVIQVDESQPFAGVNLGER